MVEKKTVIWVSLIISFVMMIVSIFSYFEITRYFKLKNKGIESYIKSYPRIARASDTKVVVSFYIQDNLDKYKAFLNSILDQTVRVNSIEVNISNKDKTENFVPQKYRDVVSVYYIGADYGQYNGLLPTLERETDKNTIVIWVKPDHIYPSDMIQSLIESMKKDDKTYLIKKKGSVVAIASKPDNIYSTCFYSSTNSDPQKIKSQDLSDIAKCMSDVSCPHIYNI